VAGVKSNVTPFAGSKTNLSLLHAKHQQLKNKQHHCPASNQRGGAKCGGQITLADAFEIPEA
jgi:hypothetical protein